MISETSIDNRCSPLRQVFPEGIQALTSAVSFHPLRYRPAGHGNWSGHLSFANDLVRELCPSLLVELGTHYGESYFGFCQSVAQNGTGTLCYSIDTWQGDEHAGLYGEEVYQEVTQYNERLYRSFSYLLRSSFDEALGRFAENSIDLLHIDGCHTYDAVSRDFEKWFPKVRPGGIVLLHDIAVRHSTFAIWKFWDELRERFPDTFTFHHWWGLGVIRKPDGGAPQSGFLSSLFSRNPVDAEAIRRYYVLQTFALEYMHRATSQEGSAERDDRIQIFPFGVDGYEESTSYTQSVRLNQTQTVRSDFEQGLGNGPVRIDFCDSRGVAEISRIAVLDATGHTLWTAADGPTLSALTTSESVTVLQLYRSAVFISAGSDPQLFLPDLPDAVRFRFTSVEVELVISDSLDKFVEGIRDALEDYKRAVQSRQKLAELTEAEKQLRAEKTCLNTELNAARAQLVQDAEMHAADRSRMRAESRILQNALEKLRNDMAGAEMHNTHLQAALLAEQERRISLEKSLSWRVTRPFRALGSILVKS